MDAGRRPRVCAMSPLRLQRKRSSDREGNVFRPRRQRSLPPLWRQGLEGVLMLLLGVGLLALLSWLPQRIDPLLMVSEMIADLIRGLSQLLEALLGLGSVLLLAGGLLLGLVCLCGGAVRLVRAGLRTMRAQQSPQRQKRSSRPQRLSERKRLGPSGRNGSVRWR